MDFDFDLKTILKLKFTLATKVKGKVWFNQAFGLKSSLAKSLVHVHISLLLPDFSGKGLV